MKVTPGRTKGEWQWLAEVRTPLTPTPLSPEGRGERFFLLRRNRNLRQRRHARVLEARGGAAVLAVLLGAVERGVGGAQQLVLLLLDRGAGSRVRADRGEAERRGDDALEVQRRLVEAVRPEEERRAADRRADRLRDLE